MRDTVLGTTAKKDLGVTIRADMKVSEQCGIAASNGNQILGLIRRNITYMTILIFFGFDANGNSNVYYMTW